MGGKPLEINNQKHSSYWHKSLQNTLELGLTSDALFKNLKDHAYCAVPFLLDSSVLDQAVQAFFRFLDEPDSVKKHIDFSIAPLHRRGDVGYKRRESEDHIYDDSKDFFHFHPALFKRYTSFLKKNPVVNDFVTKALPLWNKTYETIWTLLKNFESDYPDILNQVFGTEDVHILLRFLRYDWHNSGRYLAKPHYDAGSFTLAISESCPGLRIGTGPETLKPIKHEPDKALFMLSSNFEKVIPSNFFKAGWHDVVQLDETAIGKNFSRWAVVAFIEADNVTALGKKIPTSGIMVSPPRRNRA